MRWPVLWRAAMMMKLIVLAMWIGLPLALYKGLAAQLLPHQPRWQAGAIVGGLVAAMLVFTGFYYWASQRPNYGVDDGGEEFRTGRPESR